MRRWCVLGVLGVLVACGCDGDGTPSPAAHDEAGVAPTNRIDIPPPVRQNLGITFVQAEKRVVERTLRAPGRFEYLPTARREYRAMLPGRVEVGVERFEEVEAGSLLFTIDSPAWRDLQAELTDAEAEIQRHRTRLESFGPLREAHRNHETLLAQNVEIRSARVAQLEEVAEAGGGRRAELNEARGALATARADLAEVLEKEAELEADEAESRAGLSAAEARRSLLLDTAASLAGLSRAALVEEGPSGVPRWRAMDVVEVRAGEGGVVESLGLTNGAWASQEGAVVTVVRADRLVFRASGLQSDLGRLRDGLRARVVAPAPTRAAGAIDLAASMEGALRIGLSADPEARSVDLLVRPETLAPWARAGVSAHLEVVTGGPGGGVVAVPLAAVQRDGLVAVLFKRDPADPNRAVRVEADLGSDDGRWVEVRSGLRAGDEVVLDGAYQLMLASGASAGKGGHFHADGTFHEGHD